MKKIGVIGLGNIGGHVAANLVADGFEVMVCDVNESFVEKLVAKGAKKGSVKDIGKHAELTLLSLPSPAVIKSVTAEWLATAAANSILVDLSTNSPEVAKEIGKQVTDAGRCFLECPLTGGAPGAMNRALVFMIGGDKSVYECAKPVLDKISRATFYMGQFGTGNTAKLVNSLLAFTATWASLEGLAMAAKSGIDLRTMVTMVRTGGAGNFYIDNMVEYLNIKEKPVMFGLALAAKDAGLIKDMGDRLGVPTPVAHSIADVYQQAIAAGLSQKDWSAIEGFMEKQSGAQLTIAPKPEGSK
jgi:3-hydroxyisobutyrate dehydrogenase-like beta-hydroxyacid dehydrogenase